MEYKEIINELIDDMKAKEERKAKLQFFNELKLALVYATIFILALIWYVDMPTIYQVNYTWGVAIISIVAHIALFFQGKE